jgi:hypothetical protein
MKQQTKHQSKHHDHGNNWSKSQDQKRTQQKDNLKNPGVQVILSGELLVPRNKTTRRKNNQYYDETRIDYILFCVGHRPPTQSSFERFGTFAFPVTSPSHLRISLSFTSSTTFDFRSHY